MSNGRSIDAARVLVCHRSPASQPMSLIAHLQQSDLYYRRSL